MYNIQKMEMHLRHGSYMLQNRPLFYNFNVSKFCLYWQTQEAIIVIVNPNISWYFHICV
jgi:hypothetical protein